MEEFTIYSELLCYTFHHTESSTAENISRVVANFYSSEDIIAAKRLLWDTCGAHLQGKVMRVGTAKRTAEKANVDDIIAAAISLDSKGYDVKCYARNPEKMPLILPEQQNSIAVAERVVKQEAVIRSIESTVADLVVQLSDVKKNVLQNEEQLSNVFKEVNQHTDQISEVHDKVKLGQGNDKLAPFSKVLLENNVSPVSSTLSTDSSTIARCEENISVVTSVCPSTTSSPPIPITPLSPPPSAASAVTPGPTPKQTPTGVSRPHHSPSPPTTSRASRHHRCPSSPAHTPPIHIPLEPLTDDDDDGDGVWHVVNNKRFRRRKNTPRVITGSRNVFGGLPPSTCSIFVNRFHRDFSTDMVWDLLVNAGIHVFKCEKMSHPEARGNSFKVVVHDYNNKRILDPIIWPIGVQIRKFYYR